MKKTVVIVFNSGSYGTYLEWCLTTLVNGTEVQEPFTNVGNSHKFSGNHLVNIANWRKYVSGNKQYQFVRLHPKTKNTDSITAHLLEIANDAQNIIYLYPDQSRVLLGVNNFFYKVRSGWITYSFGYDIDPDKIYQNWPVSRDIPIDQVPNWIMREFLSYYLMPAWLDQVEWDNMATWSHPKSLTVTVSELLFDFENTLLNIQKFCNLDYQLPVSSLVHTHGKNLQLQAYIDHDRICHSIIESIKLQTELEWPTLTLPSEAWVQWELRNQGFEIRCDGLDKFPTNSVHLRELLYSV
jgi:hypothetical protein